MRKFITLLLCAAAVFAASAQAQLLRNDAGTLPIGRLDRQDIAVVTLGKPLPAFTDLCRRYAPVTVVDAPDGRLTKTQKASLERHTTVIAAVNGAKASAVKALEGLPGLVTVYFGQAKPPKDLKTVLTAPDASAAGQREAAQVIFGGKATPLSAKTRLGYSTPEAEGLSGRLRQVIDSIIPLGIANGAFPGAQLVIVKNGNIVVDDAWGTIARGDTTPVTPYTLYDLASVSKCMGTLPGVMKAYDMGLVCLDSAASVYIPGLRGTGKDSITVRELLHHESGMRPSVNTYDIMFAPSSYTGPLIASQPDSVHTLKMQKGAWANRLARRRSDLCSPFPTSEFPIKAAEGFYVGQRTIDTMMSRIYHFPLRDKKDYTYSCLNFCLLMDMTQRVTGQPNDRLVTDSIFAPLGAYRMCYRAGDRWPLGQIAATEVDTFFRPQLVHGYVHDETAAAMGGLSGNAGLFGTATDLAKMCQMWLNGGTYGGARVLSQPTVKLFTTDKSPTSRRGLGFDKPDADPKKSPTSPSANPSVYGHTGFTGTRFWIDPTNDFAVILLTNRVNPTRDNPAFTALNVTDAVMEAVYASLPR